MDTLTYAPSFATQGVMTPRVLRAQYGDGYAQEAADGINAMLRKWTIVYNNIQASGTGTTLKNLDDFFVAQAGYKKFLWTQPIPFDVLGALQFVCVEWHWTWAGGLITGLTATVEQRAGG
jgi:phage-related protein